MGTIFFEIAHMLENVLHFFAEQLDFSRGEASRGKKSF